MQNKIFNSKIISKDKIKNKINDKVNDELPNLKKRKILSKNTNNLSTENILEKDQDNTEDKNDKDNKNKEDREKYKKTSIKNSNYIRPELTYTDLLTKEQIETLLIDFEEIKNISDVPIGTFIRYFEFKENELKFRVGGILSVKKPNDGYIYLKNNQINWPVQLKNCLLFRKLTTIEVRKEFDKKFLKQEKEINDLLSMIRNLQTENTNLKKKLKELNNKK